jgi:hypothetical protein
MTVKTETPHAGAFLVSEPDTNISRKAGTLGSGNCQAGTVLGQLTSGGNYVPLLPGADTGAQIAAAILFAPVDASGGAKPCLVVHRLAAVNRAELVWPPGISENDLNAAIAALEAKNIALLPADAPLATVSPTRLVFQTVPAGGEEATNIGQVVVRVENAEGMLMTGDNATSVALAKVTGSGTLTVTGGTPQTAVNGIVTFAGITFSADDTYTITATASGLTAAVSGPIVVTAAE